MKVNAPKSPATPVERTHAGGPAAFRPTNAEIELRRTVMACMLWEDTFYEKGESIADRIKALVPKLPFEAVAAIAIEAREKMKLRHVPLLIVREAIRNFNGRKVGDLITRVIQRPDEMTELLAIYWKDGRTPLATQLKRGLGRAVNKFNAFQLARYRGERSTIALRDVIFLAHAKPADEEKARNQALLVNKSFIPEKIATALGMDPDKVGLPTPETWETKLSAGGDKKEVFESLLREKKLGALALLRNLRGMMEAGVDEALIFEGIATMNAERVLPFRFITAARYAKRFEPVLETAMLRCLDGHKKLPGRTILLVDHSGSMVSRISSKSELTRMEAAMALAILLREVCEDIRIFAFSARAEEVPARRGFALRDAIDKAMPYAGTYLGAAVKQVKDLPQDRMIVITDEQTADVVPDPAAKRAYMINVASYRNGVDYGRWTKINGWSEAVVDYIVASE